MRATATTTFNDTTTVIPTTVAETDTWDTLNGLPALLSDGTYDDLTGQDGLVLEQTDVLGKTWTGTALLHVDRLGSTRLLTETSGQVAGAHGYTATGVRILDGGLAVLPYAQGIPALQTNTPFGYAGSITDPGIGWQYLRAPNGNSVCNGITNDVLRRQLQHGARFTLDQLTKATGLTRGEARAVEQALIVRNPGFLNKMNSISPKQAYHDQAVAWGEQCCDRTDCVMTTNLQVLKPSRKKPRVGDVFTLQIPDGRYLFGRLVSTEADAGWSMHGANLIYIFRCTSPTPDLPDRSETTAQKLLVGPMMTNNLPWSKGYFQTVANLPIEPDDVLRQHCFRRSNGQYFDEHLNELPGPIEPCGDFGLHSYRTIDDEISGALGIPLAPD